LVSFNWLGCADVPPDTSKTVRLAETGVGFWQAMRLTLDKTKTVQREQIPEPSLEDLML
jgi:hypothetical protein